MSRTRRRSAESNVTMARARVDQVEIFDDPIRDCPFCGAFAICELPPLLRSKQPDDTTHVCHRCNQGFALDGAS